MGCDTHGIIKQRFTREQLFEAIQKVFDPDAILHKSGISSIRDEAPSEQCILYNETDSKYIDEFGSISFIYKDESRILTFMSRNYKWVDEDGSVSQWYDEFEHTWLDLGYWGNSVEIMEKLVAELGGGWVQINDCSSLDNESKFHEVASVEKPFISSTKTIITMTYEELCKKLGGQVIITDMKMGGTR